MRELATAFLHIDPPYQGLVGGSIVHGWLVPKPGTHFTDIRVRCGSDIYPGIYGAPRPDLAEFFKSDQPHLLAGFSVTINTTVGRHRFILEACTIAGIWEAMETIERDVSEAEAQPDPEANKPIDSAAFTECLHVLLHQPPAAHRSLRQDAEAIISKTPSRHHLQHPPRPFHGHLDKPAIWSRVVFGRLAISGWIFHEKASIKNVFATVDLQAMQRLAYGRETPFLSSYPQAPAHTLYAGYDGFLDVPTQLPQPTSVRLYVEMEDGSWHLNSVARFLTTDHEFAKRDYVARGPFTFWRAQRSLVQAIRKRGWSVPSGRAHKESIDRERRAFGERTAKHDSLIAPVSRRSSNKLQRLHLISHNLNHEGAPLFLLEYARYLQGVHQGIDITVTSSQEGALRADFEHLGIRVQIIDDSGLIKAETRQQLNDQLDGLADAIDLSSVDLVVANTLSAWWGVHLAKKAGTRSLFYIHESTSPHAFYQQSASASVLAQIESTFSIADQVSFLTAATEHYYATLTPTSRRCITPGWIDLTAIDTFRANHSRNSIRAQLGVAHDRHLVINVGTVCERKGQHLFARAVDLLWRRHPDVASKTEFVMIGGRQTAYDDRLADFLAGLNRPNLRIIPQTAQPYPYYMAADLFVCSSYEESFPRVVLEAMAFSLPIISSDVHGIPEITQADKEALLVPAGNSDALAHALQRILSDPALGQALATKARSRVESFFSSSVILPRHVQLAHTLIQANR